MLRKLDESAGNTLAYEAGGRITDEEFKAFEQEFTEAISRHGKVRLLVLMPDMARVEPKALWEDLKMIRYRNDLERYAIVSDSPLIEWSAKLGDALMRGELKQFDTADYDAAWQWLKEPDTQR